MHKTFRGGKDWLFYSLCESSNCRSYHAKYLCRSICTRENSQKHLGNVRSGIPSHQAMEGSECWSPSPQMSLQTARLPDKKNTRKALDEKWDGGIPAPRLPSFQPAGWYLDMIPCSLLASMAARFISYVILYLKIYKRICYDKRIKALILSANICTSASKQYGIWDCSN